jgi:hypothetical protein
VLRTESLVRGAVGSAVWAAGVGLLVVCGVVFLGWATDPGSSVGMGAALRAGAQAWLLAHGAAVSVRDGSVSLPPAAVTLLVGGLLWRAGAGLVTDARLCGRREALVSVAALATSYAALATALAAVAREGTVGVALPASLGSTAAVAAVATGLGTARACGALAAAWRAVPARYRLSARAGAVGAAALIAGGLLLAAIAVAASVGDVVTATRRSAPGWTALPMLAVVVAYLPTLGMWGAAYAAGPGFALGAATAVTPLDPHLALLPAVPVFAALPTSPVAAVLAVPVALGAFVGLIVGRGASWPSPWSAVRCALLAAAVGGLLVALAAAWASGALGPGGMTRVGPSPALVGLAAATELGVGATAAAWYAARRLARSRTGLEGGCP